MKKSFNPDGSSLIPDSKAASSSLTAEEKHQLLVEWNDTQREYPRDKCIHELFEAQAERSPDAVAVVFEDQRLTYRELNQRANQLAHHLRSLGVGPDVLVGICVERSLEMVVGLLGILKAGGAYVPMDPAYPKARRDFILENTRSGIVLTQERLGKSLTGYCVRVVCLDTEWETISKLSVSNPPIVVQPDRLAYVIYTSGSTGQPKGVAVEHRSLLNLITWHNRAYAVQPDDRASQVASLNFDASVWEIWPYLTSGASLHIADEETRMSAPQLVKWFADTGITLCFLPTPLAEEFLRQQMVPGLKIRALLTGGDKLRHWTPDHLPFKVYNHYGPTESTVVTTMGLVPGAMLESVAPSIGRPIANTTVYLLDQHLKPVPIGVAAELYIGGDGLARGYLNRPELTTERFIPNPFSTKPGARMYRTGDLARYLPDGNIEFLGRIDHQVKIRGFRIELGEIENVLETHPQIEGSVVMAREDRAGDKLLVAYLVARDELTPKIPELREFLKKKLPDYMIPAAFVTLSAFPLTPNGKIDRKALPAPDVSSFNSGVDYVAPQTPTEGKVAGIWSEVLGVKKIGIHDNFFDLGGHSLNAVRIASRILTTFKVELSARSVVELPTIARLSAEVDKTAPTDKHSLAENRMVHPEVETADATQQGKRLAPASFNQAQLWFIHLLNPGSVVYNLSFTIRLDGQLNQQALKASLNELIRRHEPLRTTFTAMDGEPLQVIAPPFDVDLPIMDLSPVPGVQRETEVRRLSATEISRPFDLKQGPLVRVTLLRLDGQSHVLLLSMHHIICDGWSMDVLLRDLAAAYSAFCGKGDSRLPDLPIQYADFAAWQRQHLTTKVVEDHLAYWRQQLAGVPTVLDLPADHLRSARQTRRGAQQTFTLSPEMTTALRRLGQQHENTLFVTLLTAFQTLLHRYSGQERIMVGVPFAGRTGSEVENQIGFFVNSLPIKADCAGNPGFVELLRQVREAVWEAQAHQDLPFEKLVKELQPIREAGRNPLFQVLVALEVMPEESYQMPGLTAQTTEVTPPEAMFDLTLLLTDKGNELGCVLNYNADLFDDSTITRLLEHYQHLLAGIVKNPQQRVSDLPLLSEDERHRLLVEWNDTRREYPRDKCIHELFESQVERSPDAVAVAFEDQRLTYRELNQRANQLAHYLKRFGVGPNVLVGICLERSLEVMEGILGILKAGGAYVPLDPNCPDARIQFMLQKTKASVLIQMAGDSNFSHRLGIRIVQLGADRPKIAAESTKNLPQSAKTDDLIYVIFTSGSTGQPKGAAVRHQSFSNLLHWYVAEFGINGADRTLVFSSIGFDLTQKNLFAPLLTGGTLFFYPSESYDDALLSQLIEKHSISLINCTPSAFYPLADAANPRGFHKLASLRLVFLGGEPISKLRLRQWFEHSACTAEIVNTYGPTECTDICGFYWLTRGKLDGFNFVPLGRPIHNVQMLILDHNLQLCPPGAQGELCIGGVGVGAGYINDQEMTSVKFIPNPFPELESAFLYRTGDLARHLPDGNIEFLGRADQQVKIRGFRIELGEIETILETHPQIESAVVMAREDKSGEKFLAAYLVTRKPQTPAISELREFLKTTLPDYMVPTAFVTLESFPLTPNGKIDRKALPTPDGDRSGQETAFVAPRTATEVILVGIWSEVLGLERIGTNENFFDLGGHSLLATQVISRVLKTCHLQIPLRALFESPTIAGLASFMDQQRTGEANSELMSQLLDEIEGLAKE